MNLELHAMLMAILMIVGINFVSSNQSPDDLLPQNQPQLSSRHPSLHRARRMYALCPPDFLKIGNECYYMSKNKESWLDAHFECKDRNSKLAEPLKYADRRLKKFLKNRAQAGDDKWIGGMYNWQLNKWQWGYNGGDMKYQSFNDDQIQRSDLQYRCTTYDPEFDYMWSAKLCTERHNFICQHRMRYVNGKNRQEIYNKWNETYPNQLATEVEVYLSPNGNNRSYYRVVPKKQLQLRQHVRPTNLNNKQTPPQKVDENENLPDYLPYNTYKNLQSMQQKPHEDVIHPVENSHAENSINTQVRPKKRHSKLKLTGEVDLGQNKLRNERRKKKKKQMIETSTRTNEVFEETTRRHTTQKIPISVAKNDNEEDNSEKVVFVTSTHRPTLRLEFETSEQPILERTIKPSSSTSDYKRKLDEKAQRRQRLIQKLKELTPEERQAFLLMKQQRAEAKKKGLTYGH